MLAADTPSAFTGISSGLNRSAASVLTEQNFTRIRYWLNQLSGRELRDYEKLKTQARLNFCAAMHGFQNVNQYIDMLVEKSNDFQLSDWQVFVDHLLGGEYWFRREARLFQFLKQIVFPQLQSDAKFLSAGCGTGEEAYDLAFECAESIGLFGSWTVTGIDINSEVIAAARQGFFDIERCRLLPDKYVRHYFSEQHSSSERNELLKVKGAVKEKMAFRCENLLQLHEENVYQVIFCRNLLMDMDKQSARQLIEKLTGALTKGGYLIVSHDETLEPYFAKEQCLTPYIAKVN